MGECDWMGRTARLVGPKSFTAPGAAPIGSCRLPASKLWILRAISASANHGVTQHRLTWSSPATSILFSTKTMGEATAMSDTDTLGHQSADWFKAKASAAMSCCVEVSVEAECVSVRDSKYVGDEGCRPIIRVRPMVWAGFVRSLKTGLVPTDGDLVVTPGSDGSATLSAPAQGTELWYTTGEWAAFIDGVAAGEFDLARPEMAMA